MKTLLLTPPLLQPNTPYAATPILTAWLRFCGHDAVQADLSLELLLKLFSADGLSHLNLDDEYRAVIGDVMEFLQDKNPSLAKRFAKRGALPEGTHLVRAYEQEEQFGWDFRGLDRHDRARHLCSLFLDDIAEAAALIDPHFGFSRYAEHLASSLPNFGKIQEALERQGRARSPSAPSVLNSKAGGTPAIRSADAGTAAICTAGVPPALLFFQWLEELTDAQIQKYSPQLVGITVPFPGCLFGALAIARRIKQTRPEIRIVLGGGYANTELRELTDPAIFETVDFITLDSGMLPLLRIAEGAEPANFVRTFVRENGVVCFYDSGETPVAHDTLPPPVYDGLPLDRYFGLFEVLNPVTRLWSDGRWNKLVLAHGCNWKRCAFCDTTIDYICRYDPARPSTVCDWMESVIAATGFNGFHFVDEALPPALLAGLCDEILRRELNVEWWGNIRFEKRLTKELIEKMADAGCIAVTGGLETCCDRTLKLMNKGITVAGAEEVLVNLSVAGIMTHAYLMYGFPTQTLDETFQGLETVRRLMEEGVLHSAYWHRFALTAHSEIAREPERFGIKLLPETSGGFARNEIPFDGQFGYDLAAIGEALRTATYNYQHGTGFDVRVTDWLNKFF
ncbi:MAG: radical SAM protein [Kiritimatiellaceae bacterium]|nr:radical SAM protein [Kiritimatiellaceae bacterium]